jgi:Skp family chaperone for outer membrane proteins
LIRKLLTVESANRLGSTYGSIEIKNHPWFRSVDWKLASERKWRKPPIVPQCPRSEKELYAMLQKIAEEEGFDEESSARNDTNFVELSQEDEAAFQALEDDYEGANDENENEIDNIITVET